KSSGPGFFKMTTGFSVVEGETHNEDVAAYAQAHTKMTELFELDATDLQRCLGLCREAKDILKEIPNENRKDIHDELVSMVDERCVEAYFFAALGYYHKWHAIKKTCEGMDVKIMKNLESSLTRCGGFYDKYVKKTEDMFKAIPAEYQGKSYRIILDNFSA